MPRRYCEHCDKPQTACLCSWISPQENRLPVVVLRHPDEARHAIGTAKLIELGLTRARVETALIFAEEKIADLLKHWSVSRPILVYPTALSQNAPHFTLDFETEHFTPTSLLNQYDSLILLDGTWRNTREILLNNDWLKTIPTLEIKPASMSRYRIRQAQHKGALASIEAISEVMSALDDRFQAERFLCPFEKMIDYQIGRMGTQVYRKNYVRALDADEPKTS